MANWVPMPSPLGGPCPHHFIQGYGAEQGVSSALDDVSALVIDHVDLMVRWPG